MIARMDHWPLHARQWALVGPPLRPSDEDVGAAAAAIDAWTRAHGRAPRALLLGVTPELASLPVASLVAIDRVPAMIDALFVRGPGRDAQVGEWSALPLPAGAIDVVLGDGALSCVAYPAGYRAIAAELARVTAAGAIVALRLFAAPARRESIGEVARALAAGAIAGFHALKWRLAMAVAPADRNVRVAEIVAAFDAIAPDRAALARRTGWAPETIATIDVYRGSDTVYSFPTEAEAVAELTGFVVEARHVPAYELGERCPTIVLRRR